MLVGGHFLDCGICHISDSSSERSLGPGGGAPALYVLALWRINEPGTGHCTLLTLTQVFMGYVPLERARISGNMKINKPTGTAARPGTNAGI